jgi:hypothetical protein
MKTLVAAVALVAAIASPALARTHVRVQHVPDQSSAYGAYGQTDGRQHSSNPAYDVYDDSGHYVGSDPDPLIRLELRRDYNGRGY